MHTLPHVTNSYEALDALKRTSTPTRAFLALVVAILSKEHTNREIRAITGIHQDYTVSHLKRAGKKLTYEQLELWHNNPQSITLGHVRALCRMPSTQREHYLRKLLAVKITVDKLEVIAAKRSTATNDENDTKLYAEAISRATGRVVTISQPQVKAGIPIGEIRLGWYGYDDLEQIAGLLGYNPQEEL